jgi:hypothetical protein
MIKTKTEGFRNYEDEVLSVLAFEFSVKDHADSERKLKRRLREKRLGPYDEKRISSIRGFKDDLQVELAKYNKSKFYTGPSGKYSDMSDWDVNGLLSHLKKKHSEVPESAIESFLPYAIYIYYLR